MLARKFHIDKFTSIYIIDKLTSFTATPATRKIIGLTPFSRDKWFNQEEREKCILGVQLKMSVFLIPLFYVWP